jgi:hypothetical protein
MAARVAVEVLPVLGAAQPRHRAILGATELEATRMMLAAAVVVLVLLALTLLREQRVVMVALV